MQLPGASPLTPAVANGATDDAAAAAWIASFAEGWAAPAGAREFCAHFAPILDPGIRLIAPQTPTTVGLEAFERDFAEPLFALIPDVRAKIGKWASFGPTIFIELTISGTLLRGRAVTWPACDRVELRDGRAIERESYFDPSPLLAALARSPRAWPAFGRLQLRRAIPRRTTPKEER
jgi:SnoaL-like domain